MYNKEKINRLFKKYVETGDDKVFEQLLKVYNPMLDIVLGQYAKHSRHIKDIEQEVRLRMWQHIRNPVRMEKYLKHSAAQWSPVTYLFFVTTAYARIAFEKIKQQFGESYEITFSEYGVALLSLLQDDLLDPEILYMIRRDIPEKLFADCKRSLSVDERWAKEPKKMKEVIQIIRREIEEDFDTQLDLD